MTQQTVAVLGASQDRSKYGNKSVRAHLSQGFTVYPVNPKADEIEGLQAYPSLREIPPGPLDRVTVYLPPHIGLTVLEEIAERQPAEVWFNPGSDSPDVIERARELGLNVIQACSIVAVGMSPGQLSDE